jgi:hypothetical protein
VDELISGGRQQIYVKVSDQSAAAALLNGSDFITDVSTDELGGLTLSVAKADDETLTRTGKALFDAGIGVVSLYPLVESLEQRFLDITDGESSL